MQTSEPIRFTARRRALYGRALALAIPSAAMAAMAALAGCGSNDPKGSPPRESLLDLRITEIHYHPLEKDTISEERFEFVEIKNTGSKTVDVTDVGFTLGVTYTFPKGTELKPGEIWVLAASADRFEERYGFGPDGVFDGKLSNSGERLVLEDIPAKSAIDEVAYADGGDWPASADGGGYSLVRSDMDAAGASAWRVSFRTGGSPGKDDAGAVVINEALSHTDPPAVDAIELHNTETSPADIGGWWLSDDSADRAKFRIPAGTTIPAGGYVYFDEGDFNPDSTSDRSFRLGSHGDEVWLFADSAGCDAGYCDNVSFGEVPNGITFGRHVAGDGSAHFVIQKQASLGAANAGPRTGDVVITEIMYHSPNDTDDYLELTNVAGKPLDLFDRDRPANTWKLEGLAFSFPQGVTLAAGETILVLPVRASEARVRAAYSVPDAVRVFQSAGDLRNAEESLSLVKPEEPYLKDGAAPGDSTVPYQVIDHVHYRDGGAWPKAADGEGKALVRKAKDAFGNDPGSWSAGVPAPGK